MFIIIGYCFKNHNEHPELSDNLNYFEGSAIPLFFGVAVFDFEGNGIVINLHASMKEPEKFNMVLTRTLILYVSMLCIFSSIAYWVSLSILSTYTSTNLLSSSIVVIRPQPGGYGDLEPTPRQLDLNDPDLLLLWTPW